MKGQAAPADRARTGSDDASGYHIMAAIGQEISIRQVNVLPGAFTLEVIGVVILALVGMGLILGLNLWASRREKVVAQRARKEQIWP